MQLHRRQHSFSRGKSKGRSGTVQFSKRKKADVETYERGSIACLPYNHPNESWLYAYPQGKERTQLAQCGLIGKVSLQSSQRGDSPFVYRDGIGWPASLPYIRKIRVSVAIGTQSGIRLHKRVPMVKIWGSSKNYQNWITGKLLKL